MLSLFTSTLRFVMSAGLSMTNRRPWGSCIKSEGSRGGHMQAARFSSGLTSSSWPSLTWQSKMAQSPSTSFRLKERQTVDGDQHLVRLQTSRINRWLSSCNIFNTSKKRVASLWLCAAIGKVLTVVYAYTPNITLPFWSLWIVSWKICCLGIFLFYWITSVPMCAMMEVSWRGLLGGAASLIWIE